MPLYMMQRSAVAPAPPCDVARCRTFAHLYSVIQNSMGLRGAELQKNVNIKSLERATQKLPKSRRNRGCHEAATERILLKFAAFHFSKIENRDFQFLKGFYKGKIPLVSHGRAPVRPASLGASPPCLPSGICKRLLKPAVR